MSLKNILRKSIAALVAILLINSNCYLCGIGLSKAIAQDIKEPDIKLNVVNSQYVQFKEEIEVEAETEIEGEEVVEPQYNSGVAIQTKLEVAIEEQETNLPIRKTELMVFLPSLNGYFPQRANVVDSDTLLSTGEENNNKINQNYDSNSGLLSVSYENEEAYSNYNQESKDEFEIIYIYPAEAYTGNEEEITLSYTVNAKITFETENADLVSEMTETVEIKEKENKGDLITFGVTELRNEIYKGFMYANVENGTNYDTEFNTVSTFAILNSSIEDEMTMELKDARFVIDDENETEILTNGNVVYKTTKMNIAEFDRMFGQEGSLEIYTGEILLATVKYIEVSENEEIVKRLAVIYSDEDIRILSDNETVANIEYRPDVTSLKMKTTKPVAEGFVNFENKCTIKPAKDYGMNLEEIKGIKITTAANDNECSTSLLLKEPQTKVSVNSSNINFSTLQTSKTTLTINLDSTNAATKLFDSPIITVKLPDGLVGGNLSSREILNGNGLTIKNATANNNIITIELEGKQTKYDLTNVSGGTSIVMDIENIDFKDTIPTHADKIEIKCTQGDELKVASCDVNIISKDGLLMLTTVSNYDNKGSIITTVDDSTKAIEIENDKEEKEINKKIVFVNNYDKDIKDIQIVGKLGELDSTFSTNLKKEIDVNKSDAKVYYSENIQADYNDDSWTEEYTYSIRAYKIVLSNNELKSKDNLEISLSLKVPEKLQYNQFTYLTIGTNYIYEDQSRVDKNTILMQTPQIEEALLTNLYVNNTDIAVGVVTTVGGKEIQSGDELHEGETLKCRVTIRNNSFTEATYKILTTIDNAVYYEKFKTGYIYNQTGDTDTRYKEAEDGDVNREYEVTVPANSSVEYEYQYVVRKNKDIVTNKINILDKNNNNIVDEIKIENKAKTAKMKLLLKYAYNEENPVYSTMNTVLYIKNYESKDLKNVKTQVSLSEQLSPNSFEYYGEQDVELVYDDVTNILEINVDKIKANETLELLIVFDVNLNTNLTQEIVSLNASCKYSGETYLSNDFSKKAYQTKTNLNMNITCDSANEKVQIGDKIKYIANITNSGVLDLKDSTMLFTPSEGMTVDSAEIIYSDGSKEFIEIDSNSKVSKNLNIKKTDNITIIYNVTINSTLENMESTFSLSDIYWNTVTKTSKLTGTVEQDNIQQENKEDDNIVEDTPDNDTEDTEKNEDNNQGNSNNNDEQEQMRTYHISGIAWLDINKNGQKEAEEKLMNNITVTLVNKDTGDFALDGSGNKITIVTDSNGEYKFENIKEGRYIVLFEFDTNTYTVTTYKKSTVEENVNSDSILSTVTINGEKKLVGLTDTIELKSNKANIDIGLIESPKFDLSLDKQITEITVVDKQGTKTYEYEDGHTAKVDLVAKYMKGANVIVNYKFTITNNGDITGYVDSLLDSLPSGLEFSSELNKDWYRGTDSNVYINSLSGKAIKPGESIDVELVLTKTMTEENAGTFANNAKLEKISNLENIEEKDDTTEDNESSAILIISIKTGSPILYIGITLACITILVLGTYIIKKKVLNKVM